MVARAASATHTRAAPRLFYAFIISSIFVTIFFFLLPLRRYVFFLLMYLRLSFFEICLSI